MSNFTSLWCSGCYVLLSPESSLRPLGLRRRRLERPGHLGLGLWSPDGIFCGGRRRPKGRLCPGRGGGTDGQGDEESHQPQGLLSVGCTEAGVSWAGLAGSGQAEPEPDPCLASLGP